MTGQVDRSIDFTAKQIAERQAQKDPGEGPPDMLTRFLETKAQNPEKYTDWHVLMGAFTNVVAGADTSWVSLIGLLYYLISNPETLRKLREEMEDASTKGKLSNPAKFKETQSLQYLQAVIKEGLRVYSATGLPLWREISEPGVTLTGKFFPPGVSGIIPEVICAVQKLILRRYGLVHRWGKYLGSTSERYCVWS